MSHSQQTELPHQAVADLEPGYVSNNTSQGPLATEDSDKEKNIDNEGSALPQLSHRPPTTEDGYENQYHIEDKPDEDVQEGVREAEALTLTWTKKWLVAAYILMFLIYMVRAFEGSITGNLGPYIVSGFEAHSLIPIISIVSSIMGAVTYLTVARAVNVFGRLKGFVVLVGLATIGLILSATCTNIATYCAAQVFYAVGFAGMIFCIDIITADTSSLKDRGLAYAFTSSPYIITAFAGPKASEGFYQSNWRWGYGAFAIILPAVATPLCLIMFFNKQKAKKNGLLQPRKVSDRSVVQSIWYYAVQFDIFGIFLVAGGLTLFLLPFSIVATYADSWKTPSIIAMIIIGGVMLISFAFYERYLAPVPFIPWNLLVSRTVLGVCVFDFVYIIANGCWSSYYTSYLQVVYGVSISVAGYIDNAANVVNGVWLIVVGILIRKTGYYKWLMWPCVLVYILFTGLLIYFRNPDQSVGFNVMCQIFLALAGGTLVIIMQVAVLAAGNHNDSAALLAILSTFGNVGGAVGNSISGAIWTHTLPEALASRLPAETIDLLNEIYESLDIQLSYPMGDPTRTAIIAAYGVGQKRMLIAGTAIMVICLICILFIKNIKVSEIKQVKGMLF
ncbi:hypothetical protein I203_105397 [Kwoniella mangroviensis CBS 8507]|uniref:uncharacterized protein n=1 Tax=Kwoniella mangroviensis CBS 8507 TaxID=1296122 RepID=UPI00080D32CB|nr:uncharacterized protein I203_01214 [Kwoniella mangroviensis CBS 8507]OCF69357.1 hypothetical protein I203_01214 [Kwoniella mangroviensis CBS 8507]